jgi:hypothetical protein
VHWVGVVFSVVVAGFLALKFALVGRRRSRNRLLDDWVRAQPVVFSTPTLAQQLAYQGRWSANWVQWSPKYGGGPLLVVRRGGVEVVAPQGMMAASRDVCFRADTAEMWKDNMGLLGGPLRRKDCIRLRGRDETGFVEFALTPESGIEAAWQALAEAGVRPREGFPPRQPKPLSVKERILSL